jgi:lipopolysaccharide export system ATP-binding protein
MSIEARGLVKSYGGKRVVDKVAINVEPGEVVGLLGANGAGKTTTFYIIVGLEKAEGGSIFLDGEDITGLPLYRRAQRGLGYLAQEPSIFRSLTVEENIDIILEGQCLSTKERRRTLEGLLTEFHIEHLYKKRGYMLSGGERRRVEIARTLATSPSYILLDEPFTGVDPISIMEIQEIILRLKAKGLGVLITDHSVRETLAITDRAYIMHLGNILISGDSMEIAANELARRFYLGENFSL